MFTILNKYVSTTEISLQVSGRHICVPWTFKQHPLLCHVKLNASYWICFCRVWLPLHPPLPTHQSMVPGSSHHCPSGPTLQAPARKLSVPSSHFRHHGIEMPGPVFVSLFSWPGPQTWMTPFPLPQPNFCDSAIVSTTLIVSLVKYMYC